MTAIQTLQQNARQAVAAVNGSIVDLSIRHLLAKALRDSGNYDNVLIKLDSRRNSLSVKVHGAYNKRATVGATLINQIAKKANLDVVVRLTSSGFNDSTYRVEKLVELSAGTNTKAVQPGNSNTLVTSLKAATNTVSALQVVVGGVNLGYVSADAVAKIRAIVSEDQRPKTQVLQLLNINTNRAESVTLPWAVAEAIKNKVPSYSEGAYTVKSTAGIVSIKLGTNHWVIAG